MPLCSPSAPPCTTVVRISAPSVDSTRSSMNPSASSSRSPGFTRARVPRMSVEIRPGPPGAVPVAMRSVRPASSRIGVRLRACRSGSSDRRGPAESRPGVPRPPRPDGRGERLRLALAGAVRIVQAKDVDAGGDERGDGGRRCRRAGPTVAMIFVRSHVQSDLNYGEEIVPEPVERYLSSLNRQGDAVLRDIASAGGETRSAAC